MATTKELQAQLARLEALLDAHGIRAPAQAAETPEDRPDYIAFGSPEHATFLGLVEVEDVETAKEQGYTVYTSPGRGAHWRLEDETRPLSLYPGMDPEKAIRAVLRQKVAEFEAPPPQAPDSAPPMCGLRIFRRRRYE